MSENENSTPTNPLWIGLAWAFGLATSTPVFAGEVSLDGMTFTVPEGFTLEHAAGPPLVNRPITADFDELGRLYVSDSSGSNDKVQKQLEERPHRIVRLEDRDSDGRFDCSTVFADRMMFPEGTLWHDGSLYVAAPPSIWKLTDIDDDGVADRREEWFQGRTLTGCANDLHGPYLGRDGWIYWCKGAFADQRYARFRGGELLTRAAHIFRRDPGTGFIEPVMTGGMDNPVDVIFTASGERIFTTTFFQYPGGGRRDGLIHAIYGGVYGKVHGVLEGWPLTGEIMPVMTHLGPAAPCGLELYESGVFGAEFRGNLFSCQFNLNRVQRHEISPEGATFHSENSDFLASTNQDFHPTDVLEDADGSLVVLDTGGWYKLCCPTSQFWRPDVLGAIYRVRKIGAVSPDNPRGLNSKWNNLPDEKLAARLGDPRIAVRDRAMVALAKRGAAVVSVLGALLENAPSTTRQNAVWTLTRIRSAGARKAVRSALGDRDAGVRQAAVHSAGLHRDAEALQGLLRVLGGESLPLRRAAAEALGRIGSSKAVPALLFAATQSADRVLEHSIIYALIEIGDVASVATGKWHDNSSARRASLVALDQMAGEFLMLQEVIALLGSSSDVLRETAEWICDRHPEWAGEIAGFYSERLKEVSGEVSREVLAARLGGLAKSPSIQGVLASTSAAKTAGLDSRLTAFQAMKRASLDRVPNSWLAAAGKVLETGDASLMTAAVNAVRAFPLAADQQKKVAAMILPVGQNHDLPVSLRIAAFASLPEGYWNADQAAFTFLLGQTHRGKPFGNRSNAAKALGHAKLDEAQLARLAEQLKTMNSLEAMAAVQAFGNRPGAVIGKALLAGLQSSPWLRNVDPEKVNNAIREFPPVVREKVAEILARAKAVPVDNGKRLKSLLESIPQGDVLRGKAVFRSAKAGCVSCHAVAYVGGKLGPDLTRIGQIRNRMDLLEAVVFPSASFVRGYEPVLAESRDGRVLSGILRDQTGDRLTLAIAPDQTVTLDRDSIRSLSPGSVSLMPAGMEQILSPRELADLISYLEASK